MTDVKGKPNNDEFHVHLPTKEACNAFQLRRWPGNYRNLKSESEKNTGSNLDQGGLFTNLAKSLIDTSAPNFDPRFLSGPQFENKPANIGQQIGAQYSFGYYNGDKSKWFESKEGTEGDADGPGHAHLTNSVTLEIMSNVLPKVKHKTKQNGSSSVITTTYEGQAASKQVGTINILPNLNEEGIGFDHNHSYGKQEDFVTSLLTSIGGFIGAASNIISTLDQVASGKTASNDKLGPRAVTKIDIADTYQSSDKLSITLPFTLFTKNNFVRDIFGPIMLLNVISYPKRTNFKIVEQLKKIYKSALLAGETAPDIAEQKANDLQISDEKAEEYLNNIIPGFRIFAAAPPSYINVKHSTGIFNLNNCVITNFSYKYKGPWVSSTDKASEAGGTNTKDNRHTPWWKFWLPKNDILDSEFKNVAGGAWPSFAECSITLRTVDPLFSDDFASLLEDFSKGNSAGSVYREGVVNVEASKGS